MNIASLGHRVHAVTSGQATKSVCSTFAFFYWKYGCSLCDWIGLRYICRAQKTHLKFTTNTLIPKWSMSNCPLACWTLSNIQKKFYDIGNAPSVWSSSPQHHIIDHHHHQPTPSNDLCVRVSKGASRHTTHSTQHSTVGTQHTVFIQSTSLRGLGVAAEEEAFHSFSHKLENILV